MYAIRPSGGSPETIRLRGAGSGEPLRLGCRSLRHPSPGGVCYALTLRRSARASHAWRAWEVEAILSPLSPVVREALRPWLLAPADPRRWPPPETFEARRWPISPEEADDQSRPTASTLLREELRAIRQTLDLPPEAVSGLTRNGLLAAHGLRLRQLERWLWPFYAAREITRMIAQERENASAPGVYLDRTGRGDSEGKMMRRYRAFWRLRDSSA